MANVPRAGIGAAAGAGPASPLPAGAGSGTGIGAGIDVTAANGEFAPNVLTGWNKLTRVLSRELPADLYHSSNLVRAAHQRLARIR